MKSISLIAALTFAISTTDAIAQVGGAVEAKAQTCAACHGQAGRGGGIGPRLAGASISIFTVKAQIDTGGGAMPPGLVTGRREEDVLAYVATLISGAQG